MPSVYNDSASIEDAKKLHDNLGCHDYLIPLDHFEFMNNIDEKINDHNENLESVYNIVAKENIQARLRANILMHFSNRTNSLLVTTGNKSEISVGYCTLYGDMCGGKALINDLYKTEVYEMARFINSEEKLIPINIIEKAPSAQLSENQKDEDSLPKYEILDKILKDYIECRNYNYKEFIKKYNVSIEEKEYKRIINLVNRNEFKRSQMTVGVKVSDVSFGTGWRFPITKKDVYREDDV
jgi:NAD+ synthetase